MNTDTNTEKCTIENEDTELEQVIIESEDGSLDSKEPKANVSNFFRITHALEQIKTYKKESVAGTLALMLLAIGQIILILQVSEIFPLIFDSSDDFLLVIGLFFALAVIGFVYIAFVLTKVARPLNAGTVVSRIISLALVVYLVTIVKSIVLGHLARILFAGDYTRFELAKMGVDLASMFLGIVVVALSYSFLAALLRERELEFKNFGKSFLTLLFWVSIFYTFTFAVSLIISTYALEAQLNVAFAGTIVLALLSSLFPLWFLALGLSFHTIDEDSEDIDADEEMDADIEFEEVDLDAKSEPESTDKQELEQAGEDS